MVSCNLTLPQSRYSSTAFYGPSWGYQFGGGVMNQEARTTGNSGCRYNPTNLLDVLVKQNGQNPDPEPDVPMTIHFGAGAVRSLADVRFPAHSTTWYPEAGVRCRYTWEAPQEEWDFWSTAFMVGHPDPNANYDWPLYTSQPPPVSFEMDAWE